MKERRTWHSVVAGLPAWAFFVAILEMVFMGGPFAAYFYAAYSPVLTWVGASPTLAWLGEFFAPHLSLPTAGWLGAATTVAQLLFPVGIASFLIHAVYLYWMKFVHRQVATKLLYRYVRHPQYTSLAVAGAGLVFLWPRFANLLLFLIMLLGYYALARNEEARMERSHGETYHSYRGTTSAFFPGVEWIPSRPVYAAFAWAFVAGLMLAGAFVLRSAAVEALPAESTASGIVLYLDRPHGVNSETLQRLDRGLRTDGTPLYVVLETRERLRHLLVDSGARLDEVEIPEAPWYVVEASVRPACSTELCATNVFDPRAVRRLVALYHAGADGAPIREELPARGLHSHARMAVL